MSGAIPSTSSMASRCEVSIVIPVFNEACNLTQLLGKIRDLGLPQSEIIVVDDGSSDASADIAADAGASVVCHPYNIGNGAAVKSGIRAARGRVVVLMDGDGQHKPEDIPKLLAEADRYHMIVGARAKGSKLRLHRNAANAVYNLFASYVTKFQVQDLTSGFRVLTRRDASFPRIVWLFVAFIFACGTVHLVEATLFWQPWYRLSAAIKAATAAVSWLTVFALVRIGPRALRLPSVAHLSAIVESSGDAIVSLDRDGRIASWNAGAERINSQYCGSARLIVQRQRLIQALLDPGQQLLNHLLLVHGVPLICSVMSAPTSGLRLHRRPPVPDSPRIWRRIRRMLPPPRVRRRPVPA